MRLSSYGQLVVLHFVRSELHVGDGPRLYRYLSAIAFALKCMTQMSLHYQYESQVAAMPACSCDNQAVLSALSKGGGDVSSLRARLILQLRHGISAAALAATLRQLQA